MTRFDVNHLNYRLPHPTAAVALQGTLSHRDVDSKYSRIRFDHASFDAQVFGKPNRAAPVAGGAQPELEASPLLPDCEWDGLLAPFNIHPRERDDCDFWID